MNFQDYQEITGLTISASREKLIYAQILRTQSILETLLGFTLDPALVDENEYEETGKLDDTCPCLCNTVDPDTLEDPDPVVFAYRLFAYHSRDAFLSIDPCTAVHSVKLVKNGVTYRTLDENEYRLHFKRGVVKFLEQCDQWCHCRLDCDCVQLAVDADWVWPEVDSVSTIPNDLLMVWADMVTYYSDSKRAIKSESLGPHSYTKFGQDFPETLTQNIAIIKRYAGPNGTALQMPN